MRFAEAKHSSRHEDNMTINHDSVDLYPLTKPLVHTIRVSYLSGYQLKSAQSFQTDRCIIRLVEEPQL